MSFDNSASEYVKPAETIAHNKGREFLKVESVGQITVVFNISVKNLKNLGYK